MALNFAALTVSPGLPGAGESAYPHTTDAAAAAWAAAVRAYAAPMAPPLVGPPVAAEAALRGALGAAFRKNVYEVAAAMESAFAAFGVAIAQLVVPTYKALPPPGQVGFQELFTGAAPQTRVEGVFRVAQAIDTWMRTGTAQLIAPAPPPPIPWS